MLTDALRGGGGGGGQMTCEINVSGVLFPPFPEKKKPCDRKLRK